MYTYIYIYYLRSEFVVHHKIIQQNEWIPHIVFPMASVIAPRHT